MRKLPQRLFLVAADRLRNHDFEGDVVVALFVGLVVLQNVLEAFVAQGQHLVVLGAWLEGHFAGAFQGLDLDFTSKDGLGDRYVLRRMDVEAPPLKGWMRLNCDLQDQVARHPIQGLVALLLDPQQHAVVDAPGYLDLEVCFLGNQALA